MLAAVFSLLLLAASSPHAAAEEKQHHVHVIHNQGLPKNAKYTPKPNAPATHGTPLDLNATEPICQTVEGEQLCLLTPLQRRAVEQVRKNGFVHKLAFAHSPKAAGSTVDLVLWNMAHTVQATLFLRPANFREIRRLQSDKSPMTGGKFWFSTEQPRSAWSHLVAPDTFQFLMLRHPLARCESYFYYRMGDRRRDFAYMQNMTFPEWLDWQAANPHTVPVRHACADYYYNQLRGNADSPIAQVVKDLRLRYVFVGLSSRMRESLYMLSRLVGWPTDDLAANFTSANVDNKHDQKAEPDEKVKSWFAQHAKNDLVIWEEAVRGWHAAYELFLQMDGEGFNAFLRDAGLPVGARAVSHA